MINCIGILFCILQIVLGQQNNTTLYATNLSNFQYRGISIGGWLVLEPYITPSLFQNTLLPNETDADLPIDEYHFCKKLGSSEAEKRLTQHWEQFYNETDFQQIKKSGLNLVRLPIGYWSFEKLANFDEYVMGAQDYLDKAIQWSFENDLKVLIDLHGAPNTQNGFDNSGLRNIGYPGWQNKTEYVDFTVKVLKKMYQKYGTGDFADKYGSTILGIEVLNEPYGPALDMNRVKGFYIDTYNDAREIQWIENTIMFQEAFQPIGSWKDFLQNGTVYLKATNSSSNATIIKKATFNNVLIDHHHYEVFSDQVASNITTHLQNIKDYAGSVGNETYPSIVGEWSAALTDCAPWLNGIGLGTRYEGTPPYDNQKVGNCSSMLNPEKLTKQQKIDYRKFIEMQLYEYETNSQGWIFWCWKTEVTETFEWDFKALVKYDFMPQPLNNYKYIKNGVDVSSSSKYRHDWIFFIGIQTIIALIVL